MAKKPAGVNGHKHSASLPNGSTTWPLFAIAAAVSFKTPTGITVRSIAAMRIAAEADAAKNWFAELVQEEIPQATILDICIAEVPRDVVRMAMALGEFAKEGRPV